MTGAHLVTVAPLVNIHTGPLYQQDGHTEIDILFMYFRLIKGMCPKICCNYLLGFFFVKPPSNFETNRGYLGLWSYFALVSLWQHLSDHSIWPCDPYYVQMTCLGDTRLASTSFVFFWQFLFVFFLYMHALFIFIINFVKTVLVIKKINTI